MYDTSEVPLSHRLPMTRLKMFVARMLYRITRLAFKNDLRIVRRGGVKYELDLSEAIDLTIFIFGDYQKWVTSQKYYTLPSDAVILDVGANIGSIATSPIKKQLSNVV